MSCLRIVVFNTYCVVFLFCFVCLRPVRFMLPVFLDCPFLIASSVFSNAYSDNLHSELHDVLYILHPGHML